MEFILTFALLCFTGSLKKILTRQITRKEAEHSVSTWLIGDGRNVSGYVCNHGSLRVGNETLRPLGVAMGERRQRDPCLKHTYKNTTCWPATAYDVTTGANHSIKGRRENTSSTSSSEACVRSMAPRLEDAVSRSLLSGNHGYIRNLRRSLSREL